MKKPTKEQLKKAEEQIDRKSAEVNKVMEEWEYQHKIDTVSRKLSSITALILLIVLTVVFLFAIDHVFGFKFAVFLAIACLLVKVPSK